MGFISSEVMTVAQRLAIDVEMLPPALGEAIRMACVTKYAHGQTTWLWSFLDECVVSREVSVPPLLAEHLQRDSAILFFNSDDDPGVFRFYSGKSLGAVLTECFRFEYYVTDESMNYLICVNHHDVVFAVGAAEAWIQRTDSEASSE